MTILTFTSSNYVFCKNVNQYPSRNEIFSSQSRHEENFIACAPQNINVDFKSYWKKAISEQALTNGEKLKFRFQIFYSIFPERALFSDAFFICFIL